ncbi:MAG: hypothetical protein M0R00_01475 [Candidatus Omnitrophica bacterium]|jgi:hypothetical protein|nr:hypothetical protein [Candidatus Omnitrophota bacterium]
MAATWKKVAYASDVMANTVANANSVLYAVDDNTPAALAMAASTMVARLASGDIVAATVTEIRTLLNVENGADVTDATNVAAAGAIMESDIAAKGDLIVGTADDTAAILTKGDAGQVLTVGGVGASGLEWKTPAAPGDGDFKADGTVAMTGNLDFDNHQAVDMMIQAVANEAAVAGYADPQLGKLLWATSELTLHICTAVA